MTRRPGRPTAREGPAITHEALVEEALRALGRSGYGGLSLRGLARTLGVSLATVQRHFATKDELWRAAVDRATEQTEREQTASGTRHALSRRLRQLTALAWLRPGITAAMWNDVDDGADDRLDYLTSRIGPRLAAGRDRLNTAIEAGHCRGVSPDVVLAVVAIGVTSMASAPEAMRRLFAIDLDDIGSRDAFADAVADLLLHGILSTDEMEA